MGVRLRIRQVVDRYDLDLVRVSLDHCAERDPAYSSEAVDPYLYH